MSDLSEMVKEIKRAVELGDFPAARAIAAELKTDAAKFDLAELGDQVEIALDQGHIGVAMDLAGTMGRHAAIIDRQPFGPGFGLAWYHLDNALLGAGY